MPKILPIITKENKILITPAKLVAERDITGKKISDLIQSMQLTLKNTPEGIGLAAPQVGSLWQVFIVDQEALKFDPEKPLDPEAHQKKKRDYKYFVFINPQITKMSKKKTSQIEGCLSVPGVVGMVLRPEKITIMARDETGRKFSRGAAGFFARVIQHECDHLEGIL